MKKKKNELLIYAKKWIENSDRTIFEFRSEFDGIDNREPLLLGVPILSNDAVWDDIVLNDIALYLYHVIKNRPYITRYRIQYNEETYSEGGINQRARHWSKLRQSLSLDEITVIHNAFSKGSQSIQL